VWIAPDSIPDGSQWEPQIVSGIMEKCTHFLVIISAASVTSEWVLKEIRLAESRYKDTSTFVILPLVVGRVGDYPGSGFINNFQQIEYRSEFEAQLEEVAAALELRPVIPNQFTSLITEKTEGFVGRDFVFTAIDKFCGDNASGYFIVQGDPGIGKSSILAEFVSRTGCIAHFNVLSQGINRANQFLNSICKQLVARYTLPYASLPPRATEDGAFLAQLLDQVASKLAPDQTVPIAVDALDEVDRTGLTPGANILYLPPSLPRGVFFVMTKRLGDLPFMTGSPQLHFNLMDYPVESRGDVRIYIHKAAERPMLKAWIEDRALSIEHFVNILADKSENNFMYLRYVLPEIELGVYEDLKVEHLPSGLEGYYEAHWSRMGMLANPLPRTKIRIVYILSKVTLPVSRRLIADFAREEPLTVQAVLNEWKQFLREQLVNGERHYSIYHTSFRDFLHRRDIVQAAGESVKDISSLISDNIWGELYPNE
jgi:hypothetical protein